MTGEHLDQDAIGVAAVRQVATLMAAAAIIAPQIRRAAVPGRQAGAASRP
jgi:hypothetical protein